MARRRYGTNSSSITSRNRRNRTRRVRAGEGGAGEDLYFFNCDNDLYGFLGRGREI